MTFFLHCPESYGRRMCCVVEDLDFTGDEVALLGLVDVDELLRVAIEDWEPRALHLHLDAMSGLEGVSHVGEVYLYALDLAGSKRLGRGETVTIAASHNIGTHHYLALAIGAYVDNFNHKVGICGAYRGEYLSCDATRNDHILG